MHDGYEWDRAGTAAEEKAAAAAAVVEARAEPHRGSAL
jgi:hypothetical protein